MNRRIFTVFALVVFTAMVASAGTITVTGFYPTPSGTYSLTDWATTVNVAKFNPALGTLTSVAVTLVGGVQGDAGFENHGSSVAAGITLNLQSQITLTDPISAASLVVVLPTASTTDLNVPGFDGVIDFGGTSGKSYTNLVGSASNSATYTSAIELADFTGAGNIGLGLAAKGTSSSTGGGNVVNTFTTSAAGAFTIVYTYEPPPTGTPEPATMAMLGSALIGLGLIGRKRFAR